MIDVVTLKDGAQSAASIAERLRAFIASARESLDIAIYDFNLSTPVEGAVIGAIRDAAARGVAVRIAYNTDHAMPIPVPPPPATDVEQLGACGVPIAAIPGVPHLMHHKYVVRDGSVVWTGSTNWTDDSWTREENVVVVLDSGDVAASYRRDFDDLWTGRVVARSGKFTPPPGAARAWFSPGRGMRISHRIAQAIARAEHRVRVVSPVITSGPILGTIAEIAAGGRIDLAGAFDQTQMDDVRRQWTADQHAAWKIPAFDGVVAHAPFGGKRSTPYA
ncbi:MAG: phospholipase D family protein, partial [Actinobacteria bacterium]|nr:phospholipase D family protein [Actinomycetota bacterium]